METAGSAPDPDLGTPTRRYARATDDGPSAAPRAPAVSAEPEPVLDPTEQRMVRLMEEFRSRQRKRPDVVVRPWWSQGRAGARLAGAIGFVLEYCPEGVASAQVVVRRGRVTAEGPRGVRDAEIDLHDGWRFEGRDVECPETFANYLLRLAGQTLGEGVA